MEFLKFWGIEFGSCWISFGILVLSFGRSFLCCFRGGDFSLFDKKGSPKQAAELSVGAWLEPGWSLVGTRLEPCSGRFARHGAENGANTILMDFEIFFDSLGRHC